MMMNMEVKKVPPTQPMVKSNGNGNLQASRSIEPNNSWTTFQLGQPDGGGTVQLNSSAFELTGWRMDPDLGRVPWIRFNADKLFGESDANIANETKGPWKFGENSVNNTSDIASADTPTETPTETTMMTEEEPTMKPTNTVKPESGSQGTGERLW